jgi:hypothetical protein
LFRCCRTHGIQAQEYVRRSWNKYGLSGLERNKKINSMVKNILPNINKKLDRIWDFG